MRFIHTADIHLDSPLNGIAAYPDAPATSLRNATRLAFSELVTRAIDERIDFMVIAGDLYDGSWRDYNTGIFFVREMGRLRHAGIRAVVLFGNHDAESEMTRQLDMPDNVKTFSARKAETIRLDEMKVALHGHSFRTAAVTDNLVAGYPAPIAGYYNIGVLHTALEGNSGHASYAPCSLAELHARGYHYWALGHVHEFAQWDGASTIVFPGNLQGRHVRETGRRGAVIVDIDDAGATRVERLFIDVLRWESLRVDVSTCATLVEAVRTVGGQLEALLDIDGHVPRAVRVTLHGRTGAHGELFGLEAQLRQEVIARIAAIGHERLWLERVRLETSPAVDASAAATRSDAFGDLAQLFGEAADDPDFREQLAADLAPFTARAPLDLLGASPLLQDVRAGSLDGLLKSVASGLLERLSQHGA